MSNSHLPLRTRALNLSFKFIYLFIFTLYIERRDRIIRFIRRQSWLQFACDTEFVRMQNLNINRVRSDETTSSSSKSEQTDYLKRNGDKMRIDKMYAWKIRIDNT